MSDFVIVGKKGTGKSKYAVQKIHEYLGQNRKVATNLDLHLDLMCRPDSRHTVIRVPDKPTAADLEIIGLGNEDIDEEKNGALILDECGAMLNARNFSDKGRMEIINFGIHGRKKGWDTYYICQDLGQIDKQVREALIEYVIRCVRLDKVKIPIIGFFLGKWGRMPKVHFATTRLMEAPDIVVDREFYKAKFYEKCYNTRQIFRQWIRDPKQEGFNDEIFVGPYSMLSAWHLVGRYGQQRSSWWQRFFGIDQPKKTAVSKPRLPLVDKLAGLPAEERIRHWRRLNSLGAI